MVNASVPESIKSGNRQIPDYDQTAGAPCHFRIAIQDGSEIQRAGTNHVERTPHFAQEVEALASLGSRYAAVV